MPSFRPILFCIPFTIFGAYSMVGSLMRNGLSQAIELLISGAHSSFPGAPEPFKRSYTGIFALDAPIVYTVPFLTAMLNGDEIIPESWLLNIWMIAQFAVLWTAMMLEARRLWRKGSAVSWASVWGMGIQLAAIATIGPMWAGVSLATEPERSGVAELLVESADLDLIPAVTVITFGIPFVVMSAPAWFGTSASTHYNWHALWQIFPITSMLLLAVSRQVYRLISSKSTRSASAEYMLHASRFYSVILSIASITHLPILALSLLPLSLRNTLASTFPSCADLIINGTFSNVFVPSLPWASPTVDSYNPNSHDLSATTAHSLRYDILVPIIPVLAWAWTLYRRASCAAGPSIKANGVQSAAVWFVLGGPYAAVLALLRERDRIVCEKMKGGKKE